MITCFYEVRCDFCNRVINRYPIYRPDNKVLSKDGILCTPTKQFCSEECYDYWNHNRQENQYWNLRQHGRIHNNE